MQISEHFSLKTHNTFGIDATCRWFVEYDTETELLDFLHSGFLDGKDFFSIGGGSNLLFTKDYAGVLLHSCIKNADLMEEDENEIVVRVGAGVVWDDFVALCVSRKWYGAENLSLIPGEVGAAPVQNIGAYGVEAGDIIKQVEGINPDTGEQQTLAAADCRFGYRDSIFKHELKGKFIVTQVVFRLSKRPDFKLDYGSIREELAQIGEVNLSNVREAIIRIRNSKLPDPAKEGNAGSFFKNPVVSRQKYERLRAEYADIPSYIINENEIKIPAAWLIEQAGWKGKQLGNAAVHSRQALVLVNRGNATGKEVLALSDSVCKAVWERFDIRISPEVIVI